MPKRDLFRNFPDRVRAGLNTPDIYARLPDLFAFHGATGLPPGSAVLFALENGAMSVCRGQPTAAGPIDPGRVTPVYARQPDGPPSVPTGRVFVRFREQVRAQDRRAELEKAGYEVLDVPPYAPHAAWVRAAKGGIAASLSGLEALERLTDIVHVEPQFLTRRARR